MIPILMKNKEVKINWNNPCSIKVPLPVLEMVDNYKNKHGFTSRGQAIVAMSTIADQIDKIEKLFESERKQIVNEIILELGSRLGANKIS